ncbi:hypothetical protein ABZY14_14505 [Streptomyces sp. NPDC006617]|uniref:hypothetical protein n=1 Tax=Streptomyces sp. NPDC006617 TaxID=3155354 RepID=UPI0033B042DB
MRGAEGGAADRAGAEAGMGARHGEDDGRRPAAPGGTGHVEALLTAALRGERADAEGERRAVAAFRTAREAEPARAVRTRRRDDWRPRTARRPGRSLRTALSVLLASFTLGGVAYAAMGGGSTVDDDGPDRRPSTAARDDASVRPVATPSAPTRGPAAPGPVTTPPGDPTSPSAAIPPGAATPPDRPATGRDVEARCRAYERLVGRGEAPDTLAWQRLVAAAGGAERVEAYCTERLALPTGPGPSTDAGDGADGNGAGNSGVGDTGAGIGADGLVGGETGVGGSAAAQVPRQNLP